MNPLYRIYCRVYQKILYIASAFLSFREPTLLVGLNSNQRILSILQENGLKRMLLATDAFLATSEPFIRIRQQLETSGIQVTLFSDTLPNPSIQQIETVCSMYRKHDCQGLIAYGGGSVIDLAKVVAAASSNPSTPIRKMRGLLKIRHKLPLLIAIPTTAGTGSEATVAAVVTDEDTKEKYAINDPKLIPKVAILDPINVQGMPFNLAAATGLDALTHAIEAYIGSANTPKTKRMAVS
ncbi:MAG: iron-containing alcohol dehydrogenase, partial [Candidatus Izemoplasmatales bacterium]|nr:iron-containing alcohol dehydrogenase [Candidatus Izemoplasmatales bacterium]